LMSHVEVRVSERRLKAYGLGVPKFVTKEASWREWAEVAYKKVSGNPPRPIGGVDGVGYIRERKRHDILVGKLHGLREGLATGGWIFTGDRQSVAFKPVTVDNLGQGKLWNHGDRWLLMSATVISADELLESLGCEKEWRLVKVGSTFKPENRRVVVWPVASMTYKTKDTAYPKIVDATKEIVVQHPGVRILIHSCSYELTRAIHGGLSSVLAELEPTRPVFSYASSFDKEKALSDYLTHPNAILVAPSLDRGVDLPGDKCRVQVIAKTPFLNLQDKQVSARLYGTGRSGKTWYSVNAIRTIVQMCGRGVRSDGDWCVTYILDRQFVDNIWATSKRLIPKWWVEGLEWRIHNNKERHG